MTAQCGLLWCSTDQVSNACRSAGAGFTCAGGCRDLPNLRRLTQRRWRATAPSACRRSARSAGFGGREMSSTILDCSSPDAALKSLGDLLVMSGDELRLRLSQIDLRWEGGGVAPEDQLVGAFGYEDQGDLPAPGGIRWFHATRAPESTTFEEGILPTLAALPKLWESLGVVASKWSSPAEWVEYRRSFDGADRCFSQQFHRKVIAPGWEGPFAFLVRDAAIGRCGDHKDFTQICETLEDICADYEDVTGRPLRRAYEEATRPCLVVFTAPGSRCGAVRAALNYAHRTVQSLEHSLECNTNYGGMGEAVPPGWVDHVEWLPKGASREGTFVR